MEEEKIEVEVVGKEEEESILVSNDDGTMDEVYRDKRTGNIVTDPRLRNQNQDNTRREKCWDLYLKSIREGNPNAKKAALEAGFAYNTASNMSNISWFKAKKDKLRDSKAMSNSERNLQRFINLGITKIIKGNDGNDIEVFDPDKARIVADITKFVLTTIGKDKYSTKAELKVTATPTPILELDAVDITPLIEPNEVVD